MVTIKAPTPLRDRRADSRLFPVPVPVALAGPVSGPVRIPVRVAALVFAVLLGLLLPAGAAADTRVQSELDTFATLVWTGDELGLASFARGQIDFRSPRGQPVQGRLQLRTTLGDDHSPAGMRLRPALLEVPRANLRFRFPITEEYTMRVTAGRDRVTWGVGSLFNAADLLFGADGTAAADFTEIEDVRDETDWLTALYFPIGDLSYLETIALPPLPDLTLHPSGDGNAGDDNAGNGSGGGGVLGGERAGFEGTPPVSDTSAGLRLHTQLAGVSIEPSYLWDGRGGDHNVALALQRGLVADFYAAARLRLDEEMPGEAARVLEERSIISTGVYYAFNLGRDRRLTGRFETLINPGGDWEKQSIHWQDHTEDNPEYGILLYPELVYSPGRTVDVIARSVVSPIDRSALITCGVSWNVFGGFRAQAFAGVEAGDDEGVFGWDRPGSLRLSTGFNYRF